MSRMRKRRGISFGTIFMLVVTICVSSSLGYVLPQLQGSQSFNATTGKVLEALSLSGLPELSLSNIPIMFTDAAETQSTAQPTATASIQLSAATEVPVLATPIPATDTATPNATAAPTPLITPERSFTAAFTGSIMVEDSIRKGAWIDEADKYDFSGILQYIEPELKSADLCVVQLENVIAARNEYTDNVTTDTMVSMLVDAGVDMVGLAYPKFANEGFEGVASTIDALRSRGLAVAGANTDAQSAAQPTVMTLGGIRVAVLQYTDSVQNSGLKKLKNANAEYAVSIAVQDAVVADIQKARQAGAEIVIVCMNWGEDDASAPNKTQKSLAQAIADAGADVIIGTGTKSVQSAVWLQSSGRRVLCAYSLGALLNEGRSDKNVASYILQLSFRMDADGVAYIEKMECIPTYTWRYKADGKYRYFVVPSAEVAPDNMSEAQIDSKERALKNVQKILNEAPFTVPELAE